MSQSQPVLHPELRPQGSSYSLTVMSARPFPSLLTFGKQQLLTHSCLVPQAVRVAFTRTLDADGLVGVSSVPFTNTATTACGDTRL